MCSKFSPFYTTVINVTFWTVSLVPALITIWEVQDKKTLAESPAAESEDTEVVPAEPVDKEAALEKTQNVSLDSRV